MTTEARDPVAAGTVRWTFPKGSVIVNEDGSVSLAEQGYVLVNADLLRRLLTWLEQMDRIADQRDRRYSTVEVSSELWKAEIREPLRAILAAIQEQEAQAEAIANRIYPQEPEG